MDRFILSQNHTLAYDDDCLNHNVCVVGSPGSGKSSCYEMVNIAQGIKLGHSLVITDTKGDMLAYFGNYLKSCGYDIKVLDLIDLSRSDCYDPLAYVTSERDVLTVSEVLCGRQSFQDPYWDDMAKYLFQSMCAYICLEQHELPKNFDSVIEMFMHEFAGDDKHKDNTFEQIMQSLALQKPYCLAARAYNMYSKVKTSDTTTGCILSSLSHKLLPLVSKDVSFLTRFNDIDLRTIGDKKTAVFVCISDNDRSMDKLGSMFFTQLINVLVSHADKDFTPHRLPIPVDIHLDDFGTHIVIPSFENIIATVRSRGISISIILQSFSQLNERYGESAQTMIACCDTLLYYGGNDVFTAEQIAKRTDTTTSDVLSLARHKVWVIRRCFRPVLDSAFHISLHPDFDKFSISSGRIYKHTPVKHKRSSRKRSPVSFSFDKLLSADAFDRTMMNDLIKASGSPNVLNRKSLKLCGNICYADLYSIGAKNVLCLFESRKQLFDELYYRTIIEPLKRKFDHRADHVILVSYSGFVDQEYSFANKYGVVPLTREGFEQGIFQMDFIARINPRVTKL